MNILIDASAAYFYHSTGIGAYATELIKALKNLPIAEYISVFNGKTVHHIFEKDLLTPSTYCDFWEWAAQNQKNTVNGFDLYHNLHNGIGMKTGSRKIFCIRCRLWLVHLSP
jgi:hypothetical protein